MVTSQPTSIEARLSTRAALSSAKSRASAPNMTLFPTNSITSSKR
jgi:hypothetical protein